MYKLDLEKVEEPEINCQHLLDHSKSKRIPEKHLLLLHWLHKAFAYVDNNKLWKILQDVGISDHLTCLLQNLYLGQEATLRTGHRTTDWFQIGNTVCQGYILLLCSFNFYAEYITIMWKGWLDETQAGIKTARRNINNLRYADDTTLTAESKEEKEPLDEVGRAKWKSWLKTQHSEN